MMEDGRNVEQDNERFNVSYVPMREDNTLDTPTVYNPNFTTPHKLKKMRDIEFLKHDNKVIRGFYMKLLPRHCYRRVESAKFQNSNTRPKLVLAGFSRGLGDCFLLVAEYTFSQAMTRAKDKSKHRRPYYGIWRVNFPYVLLDIEFVERNKYNITILEKWATKEEFDKEINQMKEEMF